MPSASAPTAPPMPDPDRAGAVATPDAGCQSRVRSLLGLPAPTSAPTYVSPQGPLSAPLPMPSQTIADHTWHDRPEDDPVTPPVSMSMTVPGAATMAASSPVPAPMPRQEQGQVNESAPARLPQHATVDAATAARPTVEPVPEPAARQTEGVLPVLLGVAQTALTEVQPPATQQPGPIEPPTTIHVAAKQEAVTIAIPGASRSVDKSPHLPLAPLQWSSMPTVPPMVPTTESGDDERTSQRQRITAPPLPPAPRLARNEAPPADLSQVAVRQAQPMLQQADAGDGVNRATPARPSLPLLDESATRPRTMPLTLLPQLASRDQRSMPVPTNPAAQGETRGDQAAWAQIEQLRRTVQGLQAKVANQPTAEQAPPAPSPPLPPPRPVIIKRIVAPATTLSAFWERRHLGRSHLRLLR